MRLANHNKFLQLRMNFPFLRFDDYAILESPEKIIVEYIFNLSDKIIFRPSFAISKQEFDFCIDSNSEHFHSLVFHVGLIELLSYWKTVCPPQVIIKPFKLSADQINWWKKLYYRGLGEFFYINSIQINLDNFLDIECISSTYLEKLTFPTSCLKNLVPIGGGKDSAVTLDLLTKHGLTSIGFLLNPRASSKKILQIANCPALVIERTLDHQLLELNQHGNLNGHTPFSALLSFYTLIAGALLGTENIVLSNEASANEATIRETNINHQYSKSFEYEADFRHYMARYIGSGLNYFSLLRPLHELQITKLFAKCSQYHDIFRSCNVGSKTDSWCGNCSKCLFAYIMLSPFITQLRLMQMFNYNLLEQRQLLTVFLQLIGEAPEKPFECIGTIDEVNLAVHLSIQYIGTSQLPYLLEYYQQHSKYIIKHELLSSYASQHFLPMEFSRILQYELAN